MTQSRDAAPALLTPRQYLLLYLREPRIRLYLALAGLVTGGTLLAFPGRWEVLVGVGAALAVQPFVEYAIHRFLFHNRVFYRFAFTAGFWKHMHYEHHLDPTNRVGIFGPPELMVPFAAALTLPLGYILGGLAGCGGALAAGLWVLVIYEYFHGAAHLLAVPPTPYGRWLKRIHTLHHFHSERGNFGVTTPLCDLLFGSYYADPTRVPRSPTVRNLGYTEAEAERYPWVQKLGEADSASRR